MYQGEHKIIERALSSNWGNGKGYGNLPFGGIREQNSQILPVFQETTALL